MRRSGFVVAIILLFAACAQVREITGGEKDSAGPALLSSDPPNYSTRFIRRRIELRFDERVRVEHVTDRLLVSPPLTSPPEVRVTHGRDVIIELTSPLLPNTTYTFGFGEVIKDLTEGNAASGVDLVVSTGDVLDSLMISGGVRSAFEGSPTKDVLVMLYDATDTSTFRYSRPAYATRTDVNGVFALRHLRRGEYRIVALRDKNANYRYDLPNEEIAFASEVVSPGEANDSTRSPITLYVFQEVGATQRIREARVTVDGALRVLFEQPALNVALRDVERTGGVLQWTPEWSATRDTVLLWPSDTVALSDGAFQVTTDEGILDTLRYRKRERTPFFTGLRTNPRDTELGYQVLIEASRPIVSIDTSLFTLSNDDGPVRYKLTRDTTQQRQLILTPELAPGSNAKLTILPNAVTDFFGGSNDTLRLSIGRAADRSTGTLRINLSSRNAPTGPFLLDLLDTQGRVVRKTRLAELGEPITWARLSPGNHTLRLIADTNDSGAWDPGVWSEGKQPEEVWHHSETINVRAAWDVVIDWKLDP